MPKVILEFNLPEEAEELANAQKGGMLFNTICDLAELFRRYRKYHVFEANESGEAFFEKLDAQVREILNGE